MGGFLNTSTAQFDDIYGFAAPHSPINPQGFPDHVSAPESSPANRISSATTSMDVDPEQSTAHEQEQLEGSTGAPCILDDVSAQASTGSMSPLLPNRQSASFSPIPYGYPITPMSVPVQPLAPGQLPRKSVSQIDQPVLTEPEANSDVTQPSSHPCPMVSSMQSAGYSQPQQYVWVPVPIMTGLPPPPSATMSRAPHNVRPGGPGGDNAVGRRC